QDPEGRRALRVRVGARHAPPGAPSPLPRPREEDARRDAGTHGSREGDLPRSARSARMSGGGLLLFWDYDTQWGGDRSRAGRGPQPWGALEFEETDRILDLLDAHGLRAAFAVVGAAALPGYRPYHDPVQVRRIHERGHEVGSHA